MHYKVLTRPLEWACTKFCRIDLDRLSVWQFIMWLCDRTREQVDAETAAFRGAGSVWYDPVEAMWGFDAPRQRMAKLLWRLLHNASDEEFHHNFSFAWPDVGPNTIELLSPVQARLKWVMDGLEHRQKQDEPIGQAAWGERWWLPPEQTQVVREQLACTHPELLEHGSDYDESVRVGLSYYVRNEIGALPVPSHDPKRAYFGERRRDSVFVWVKEVTRKKFPLPHADRPYMEADGTGFEWGYPGHGPGALTRSILVDALDGDLELAMQLDKLRPGFFEKFVLGYPREKNFRMTRPQVHAWLEEIGMKAAYDHRRDRVAKKIAAHSAFVAEREELIRRIQEMGGLRSQRFDIVPESFESALYLDLMRMLEAGGASLRCARCKMPISDDGSRRANKQRARSRKGEPIYHAECAAEEIRARKRADWDRRTKSPKFRASERARARAYRKLS